MFASLVHREKKPARFETPRHPAIDILDTRWKQVHNAIHRETAVNARKDRVSFVLIVE